jgi:hypothetical protein
MTITPRRIVQSQICFRQFVRNWKACQKHITLGIVRCNVVALGDKNSFWRNPKVIYSGAIILKQFWIWPSLVLGKSTHLDERWAFITLAFKKIKYVIKVNVIETAVTNTQLVTNTNTNLSVNTRVRDNVFEKFKRRELALWACF